jgi:hypothetical protein
MPTRHPWEARLIICAIMLILSFIGIVYTDVTVNGGWEYWKWIVPIYAALALWLSWYLKHKEQQISMVTIWHELLHWAALIASTFLLYDLLQMGLVSRFSAGIIVLNLISLAVFLAGIYIEPTFLFIGTVLAIFSWLVALTVEYLYAFALLTMLLGAAGASIIIWIKHKKTSGSNV